MSGETKSKGFFGRLFGAKSKEQPAAAEAEAADLAADAAAEAEAEVPSEEAATTELSSGSAPAAPETAPAPHSVVSSAAPVAAEPKLPEPKRSWLQRLKDGLSKTSGKLSEGITGLFTKKKLDAATLDDLEDLLIQADLGIETASRITGLLGKGRFEKGISEDDVREILSTEVRRVLEPVAKPLVITGEKKPHVVLVVGVNGSGKTTTIGKLAAQLVREGRKVMMAAGDTFRAAAIDQLKVWGERTGTPVIARDVGADASGLAFDAFKAAQEQGADVLLLDTAGRLQNKQALMEELEKVVRVLKKIDPSAPHNVLLVLDATTGQNALSQVDVFAKRAGVTGLIMTKLDGTARGGILVAIASKYSLPVHAIGVGEGIDDLQPFKADDFARAIAAS